MVSMTIVAASVKAPPHPNITCLRSDASTSRARRPSSPPEGRESQSRVSERKRSPEAEEVTWSSCVGNLKAP